MEPGTPDISEFVDLSKRKSRECGIAVILSMLPPDERKLLGHALDAPLSQVGHKGVAKWLDKRGHHASARVIATHRRKECGCD